MIVKSIFDKEAFEEILYRINDINSNSRGLWGKMSVSQMLAHLNEAVKVPLLDKPLPRMLIGRLVGWMAKKKLYDASEMPKNLPTAKEFLITQQKDIEQERKILIDTLTKVHHAGKDGLNMKEHPFFGKLTGDQWGMGIWKHVDHHLKQFGV